MATRIDLYSRITNLILADLERRFRPRLKPWNPERAAGRIARLLRASGLPCKGIDVLVLSGSATTQTFGIK